jgi:ring-1,2-phenylacetyl-CoA epoxidase subunit PaaD
MVSDRVVSDKVVTGPDARAWAILEDVADPEIPVLSVLDLGIVRAVEESTDGRGVTVTITPTYSGCPATEVIARDVRSALQSTYDDVEVRTRLSPAWTTDWMRESAREKLTGFGIAPPAGRVTLPLLDVGAPATCPQCGSSDVEEIAGFGSTPCKALWRCVTCREPFDYFKQH